MDFAIQDKEGNLSLPNGSTVNGSGSATPATTNGHSTNANSQSASIPLPVRSDPSTTQKSSHTGTFGVKSGLAQMLKGGVIMDVMNVEQAKVAEEAGAVAVMALERIPSLIRSQGGIARMVSTWRPIRDVMTWHEIGEADTDDFVSFCFPASFPCETASR